MNFLYLLRKRLPLPTVFILVFLWTGTPGNADIVFALQEVKEESYPFVIEIVAPAAIEMAVNDAVGLVAVVHQEDHPVHVSIFSLDESGTPIHANPIVVVLPKRGPLAAHPTYALSATFHPSLPLLYVWQDVNAPAGADAGTFEHLLIFRITEGEAKLVQACGKSSDYAIGRKLGYIAVDKKATRLYFPNLTGISKGELVNGIGYFSLDEDGLVLGNRETGDADFKAQRVIGLSLAWSPDRAAGFAPINDDIVMFATAGGAGAWDQSEARQRFTEAQIWPPGRPDRRIAAHPSLPAVYICSLGTSYAQQLKHAEGYFTSNFQLVSISGPFSRPVVLARRNMVAYGGGYHVQLISIDNEGRFLPEIRRCTATNKKVSALSYSDKFDKLYVAADKER
jgi:hypothetical protein